MAQTGFRHEHRGFELSLAPKGNGFVGEVTPMTWEAEQAVHGFRWTKSNIKGESIDVVAKAFFASTQNAIDDILGPA